LVEALAEVTGRLDDPGAVGGVAVCATSGTVLLTGPDGTPRTPALMYDDTRAGGLAGEAQDAGAELWERLAYRMQPAWALPKLLWWRDEGLLGDGARLAHQADVITAALVGERVPADSSHALKTGYDLLGECWPVDVLARLRVDPAVLPAVVRAGSVLGEVGAAAAAQTGLPAAVTGRWSGGGWRTRRCSRRSVMGPRIWSGCVSTCCTWRAPMWAVR
jgi:sugar (pentulose or hexulose) kinase